MSNLLALGSSLVWGVSDYVGGVASRRAHATVVVLWSQVLGFFLVIAAAPVLGGTLTPEWAAWGAAAGLAGAVALAAFYHGLSSGRMAVVAPVAALVGATLPVLVGLVLGERPGGRAVAGIAVALPAIWLVSGGGRGEPIDGRRAGLASAVVGGLGFGLFFVFLGQTPDTAGLWPLVPARLASIALMLSMILIARRPMSVDREVVPLLVVAGGGDMAANMLFLVAAQTGLLSVVAVLSSLFPAVTVLLARVFGETVTLGQWLGVALTLLAVGLIV